jgi:hypothetical protein
MNESELKSNLQKKYDHSTWKEILTSIFPKVEYLLHPNILAQNTDTAKLVQQIGNIAITDGNIGIFEVEVANTIFISRNRVKLREIAAKYIDQGIINGAFVFYFHPKQNDYRFTFIAKKSNLSEEGVLVKYQTAPKRYTYVLGPNEACTTAAKRLLELEHSENISLDNVIQAFSIEKLNKEFFKKYKEHYLKLCDELAHSGFRKSVFNLQNFKDKKENDKAEKPIRDFVKLLLGRIVFLHFLQKKSWLGCPVNSKTWKEGDFQFLYNLYTNYKDKNHFLSKCLNRLFFDTLNTKRSGDIFEFTKSRVPYLNGGLFDNVHPEYEQIDFPTIRFEELFDFFSQYNFTIDESSPDEHEVGIDPEMLSHIFENLLEDNKDKGAFYTPKEIVHYMCHESIIQYLVTNLTPRFSREEHKGSSEEAIQKFILNQEVSQFIRDNAKEIDSLLDKVKICDLAIGSGAFPMGMLKEIFQAKLLLYPYLKTNKKFDPAVVKRNIIQNSIYGVDIDSGAVDIARLRFWLALIVDEEEPTPLPNLDYKIMQGNSLLESFEGIDLSTVTKPESFQIRIHNPQLRLDGSFENGQSQIIFTDNEKDDLSELMKNYFSASERKEKEKLHKQIDKIVLDSIHRILDKHKLNLESALLEYKEKTKAFEKYGSKSGAQQLKKLRAKDYESIERLELEIKEVDNKFEKLSELYSKSERPFFLWHLYFQDVFDKGGFDIVIGNPPYVQLQKDSGKIANLLENAGYKTFERTGDIYSLFYELGFNLLKEKGIQTIISSSQWMKANYGKSLRELILSKNPLKIVLLGPGVFENAIVDTNILIAQNARYKKQLHGLVFNSTDQINQMKFSAFQPMPYVSIDNWAILNPIKQSINEKFVERGKALAKWNVKIYRGVLTGYNKAFIIDEDKRNELIKADPKSAEIIKPVLRGREIEKYFTEWDGGYLVSTFPALNIDITKYKAAKKYLEGFLPKIEQVGKTFTNSEGTKEKTRKKTFNKWFETQDPISFYEEFYAEKVIWKRIGSLLRFSYTDQEIYCLDSTCIATGEKIKYLTALLNSKLCQYQLFEKAPKTGMGDLIISVQALKPVLVYYPEEAEQKKIEKIVDKIIEKKKLNQDTTALENEIDIMVYKLYNLTYEEVEIIDPQIGNIINKTEYEKFQIQ